MKVLLVTIIVLILVVLILFNKSKNKTGELVLSAKNVDEVLDLEPTGALITINQLIQKKLGTQDYSVLNKSEITVISVDWLQGDVSNGGYHQYFFNSYSELAHEAHEGLKLIGAPATAEITRQAFSIFPDSIVPKDRDERQKILETIGNDKKEFLGKLDDKFYDYPDGNIDNLLIAFIKENINDFK
jgi:hypothetical protein